MRNLNNYIVEKLHLNKDTNIYKYHPKDKEELIDTIIIIGRENPDECKNGILNLNTIDTSKIHTMDHIFPEVNKVIKLFNVDVSKWDVSNVESFNNCFCLLQNFNCDLSNWNVSNCENFESMFEACYHFEGKGLENWDFRKAINVKFMLDFCFKFNADVSKWDFSNVKSIVRLFECCYKFKGDGLDKIKLNSSIMDNEQYHKDAFRRCDLIKKLPSWYHE